MNMAEIGDVLLILAGWAVAGGITLLGVYILHRLEEWGRERWEVFRPIHAELELFLEGEVNIRSGLLPPSFTTDFGWIRRGGLLHRHKSLDKDVHRLVELRDAAERGAARLDSVSHDHVSNLWDGAGLGPQSYDGHMVSRLVLRDPEGWEERLRQMPGETQEALESLGPPRELYDRGMEAVKEARLGAEAAGEYLMAHVAAMKGELDRAMRGLRRRYRGRKG